MKKIYENSGLEVDAMEITYFSLGCLPEGESRRYDESFWKETCTGASVSGGGKKSREENLPVPL